MYDTNKTKSGIPPTPNRFKNSSFQTKHHTKQPKSSSNTNYSPNRLHQHPTIPPLLQTNSTNNTKVNLFKNKNSSTNLVQTRPVDKTI